MAFESEKKDILFIKSNNLGRNQPIVPKTIGNNTAIKFSIKPIPILDVFPIKIITSSENFTYKIVELRFMEYFGLDDKNIKYKRVKNNLLNIYNWHSKCISYY